MDELKSAHKPDFEFFHNLLLKRFSELLKKSNLSEIEEEIDEIELAMNRIRWGNYNTCMECEKLIEESTLLDLPTTTLCSRCMPVPHQ